MLLTNVGRSASCGTRASAEMSGITAASRCCIAHPLTHAPIGNRCPFQSGEIASSSAQKQNSPSRRTKVAPSAPVRRRAALQTTDLNVLERSGQGESLDGGDQLARGIHVRARRHGGSSRPANVGPRRYHGRPVTASDFRRIALGFDGAEEGSHMGAVDFRVGGHIFATLASVERGYGNLMLTPEIQAEFIADAPDLFLPVAGGWGRMGVTHVRLATASRDVVSGALRTAWKLRVEKNAVTKSGSRRRRPRGPS
jgi:hypothetical protein